MDLRSRVIGTHPLNLKRQDVISPITIIRNLNEGNIERNELSTLFSTKFGILTNNNNNNNNHSRTNSELSLQIRTMILIHLNDLVSPLLPLVFEGNAIENQSKFSLNRLISLNKERIFTEVLFSILFIMMNS